MRESSAIIGQQPTVLLQMQRTAPNEFFSAVHALRGVAALWVVFFHLSNTGAFSRALDQLPAALTYALFGYGSAGVAMFFVISGFVIGHSLAGREMTPGAFGRFVVRRSVRLDPPYWATIAVAVVVGTLAHREFTLGQIGLHLLYLQEIVGVPEIQIVYWTLTYEIQFYLVTAAVMMVSWRFPSLTKSIWFLLYALALWSAVHADQWAPRGLFVLSWHAFMAGLCTYHAGIRGGNPIPLFLLLGAIFYGSTLDQGVFNVPAAFTSAAVFAAARARLLTLRIPVWLAGLGTVSYSLYLIHLPIIELASALCRRIDGSPAVTWVMLLGTILACLVGAAVLYFSIEGPSHRVAKRLFRNAA